MKIPLDFFLSVIKRFCDELDLKDVSKAVSKNMELKEEEIVNIILIFRMRSLGTKKKFSI
jgi:hypothetical protein